MYLLALTLVVGVAVTAGLIVLVTWLVRWAWNH